MAASSWLSPQDLCTHCPLCLAGPSRDEPYYVVSAQSSPRRRRLSWPVWPHLPAALSLSLGLQGLDLCHSASNFDVICWRVYWFTGSSLPRRNARGGKARACPAPWSSRHLEPGLTCNGCSAKCLLRERMSSRAPPGDTHWGWVQLGRLQGVAKSAPQEESTVVGPSSGSVINCDQGHNSPWWEPPCSHADHDDGSVGVSSGPFQRGWHRMTLNGATVMEFQGQQERTKGSDTAVPFKDPRSCDPPWCPWRQRPLTRPGRWPGGQSPGGGEGGQS